MMTPERLCAREAICVSPARLEHSLVLHSNIHRLRNAGCIAIPASVPAARDTIQWLEIALFYVSDGAPVYYPVP